ncbi:UMP-CMP kinase [Aplysia californica]|uniref:UMP-CMP kinase n=1 Tax=Aplysia californica TaxID=6500 RepID=A0ABM0JQK7_APLCA|nr:UMP-CMP kinase [Aplysia californica]
MSGDSASLYNVVFVLGGPGAGKGTQCEKINEVFKFKHLSAGELLRQERQTTGSEYGELIAKHIKDGTIVPVEITCSLLKREMENSQVRNFLIDGFPRNKDNLDGWNSAMKEVADVKRVLFFSCPDQVCVDRCLSRGATSNRTDDNADTLKKRLTTYKESTMPIVESFRTLNLISEIDASGSPEQVFAEVQKVFTDLGYKAS